MSNRGITDFQELIMRLNELTYCKENIYRGFSCDDEIYPKIIRSTNLSAYEESLLKSFEQYGLAYFSANNAIEFLSTAQHYGLPTRLLDFTYNPYIALYFALYKAKSDEDDSDYKIIYCRSSDCVLFENENNMSRYSRRRAIDDPGYYYSFSYSKHLPYTKELLARFKKFGESDKIFIAKPNFNNQRITMQQGLFVVPSTLNKEKHREVIEKNTNTILIDKSIREEVLSFLEVLGFDAYRLMPDLASISRAIKDKIIEKAQAENK